MNGMLPDIVGLLGSAICIAALAYANWAAKLDKLWYSAANLIGALLLLFSLSVHFNLAAFVMEVVWALVAIAGMIVELRARRAA